MTAPVVTVRGEAEVEVAADRATLSLTVDRTGSSAAEVQEALAAVSGEVRALAQGRAGVTQWNSGAIHVGPVFSGRGDKITGYRGSFSSEVVVHDFSILPDLLVAWSSIEGSQLNGPWWSLSTRHPAHGQVRLDAIREARSRADDYAAAFDATVEALVEVSDLEGGFGGSRDSGVFRGESMMAKGGGHESAPTFDLQPSMITITGQVTVRFTISTPDLSR